MFASFRIALTITLLATLAANAQDAAPRPKRLSAAEAIKRYEGVYKERFDNSTVRDEKFVSENILEIASYGKDKVYFRIHLEFFNAHVCNLYGIATYEDGAFVFRDPDADADRPCVLRIQLGEDEIAFDDEGGNCRSYYYCGARGTFTGVSFPRKSRRTIRYMKLLRGSSEYAEAVEAFKKPVPRD